MYRQQNPTKKPKIQKEPNCLKIQGCFHDKDWQSPKIKSWAIFILFLDVFEVGKTSQCQ